MRKRCRFHEYDEYLKEYWNKIGLKKYTRRDYNKIWKERKVKHTYMEIERNAVQHYRRENKFCFTSWGFKRV